jgi:Cu2+-exporting ATPase
MHLQHIIKLTSVWFQVALFVKCLSRSLRSMKQLVKDTPKNGVLRSVESWLESGVDFIVKYGGAVERTLGGLCAILSTELRIVEDDIKAVLDKPPAKKAAGTTLFLAGTLNLRNASTILHGGERQKQLRSLQDGGSTLTNTEERDAQVKLTVGAATIGIGILAGLTNPAFYLLCATGILYQTWETFKEAYRSVAKDHQANIHVTSSVVMGGAILSGSIASVAVAAFLISVMRWITVKAESMAQKSVSSVFARHERSVWLLTGEHEVQIPVEQVRVGDTIIVGPGEMIPVDGRIAFGVASIDQSALTGEGQLTDCGIGDLVLASSVVLSGRLYINVERSGGDTVAAQLVQALANTSEYKRDLRTRTEKRLDKLLIPYIGLAALALPLWGLSSALAILWVIPGYRMMMLGPMTMLCFMHIASRKGILLRSGRVLERLREVDTVVFDKTGTLTLERPEVGRVFCFGALPCDELVRMAVTAEHGQTHPIAVAIQKFAQERSISPVAADSPELAVGLGTSATIAGQRVLVGSERLMKMSGLILTAAARKRQAEVHERGHSLVYIARGTEVVGAFEICPTIRPEATALVAELFRRGKQVIILSGDHEAPTRALATKLGIKRFFAQVLPVDKSKVIEELHREGRSVCFVGDGINDALALKEADVSISMKGATSIATNVAHVIFMSGNLKQMIALFDLAELFEHHMRYNRLATTLPALAILAGTFAFGWGLFTAILLNHILTPFALYNSLLEPMKELSPGAQLHATEQQADAAPTPTAGLLE